MYFINKINCALTYKYGLCVYFLKLVHIKLRSRSTNLLLRYVHSCLQHVIPVPTTLVGSKWFLNLL